MIGRATEAVGVFATRVAFVAFACTAVAGFLLWLHIPAGKVRR